MRKLIHFEALALLAISLPAQQPTTAFVGVVVDGDGQAVKDAEVVVTRAEGRGFHCLDLALRHSWRPLTRTRVDKKGRFGLQVPLGLVLRVEVDHPGHAVWRREELVPGGELRIELGPPCSFRGRLLLASSGEGTTGHLRLWDEHHTELCRGRTDAKGNFVFERLPACRFTCDVEPDSAMSTDWWTATLTPDAPVEHDFRLAAGALLQGTVTDAATGEPIAGAQVGEGWTLHKAVTTDAGGKYRLQGYGDPGRPDVQCRASGYLRGIVNRNGLPKEPTTLDIAIERGVSVIGTVLDAAGDPCANAYVAVVSAQSNGIPWLSVRTAADGTFRCDGVDPRCNAMLLLRRDGCATAVYALPAPAAGQIDVFKIALASPQVVQGVVLGMENKPVPGALVSLRGTNGDRERWVATPLSWPVLGHYLGQRLVRADAHGRFAFGDVAPGSYALALGDTMDAIPDAVEVEVVAGKNVPPIELSQYQ